MFYDWFFMDLKYGLMFASSLFLISGDVENHPNSRDLVSPKERFEIENRRRRAESDICTAMIHTIGEEKGVGIYKLGMERESLRDKVVTTNRCGIEMNWDYGILEEIAVYPRAFSRMDTRSFLLYGIAFEVADTYPVMSIGRRVDEEVACLYNGQLKFYFEKRSQGFTKLIMSNVPWKDKLAGNGDRCD